MDCTELQLKNDAPAEANPGATPESRCNWQESFDLCGAAICLTDSDGLIVDVNQAWTHIFGRSAAGVIGKSCWDILYPPSETARARDFMRRRLAGDATTPTTYEIRIKIGPRKTRSALSTVSFLPRSRLFLSTFFDITPRQKIAQKLRKSRSLLRLLSARSTNRAEIARKDIARELHDQLGQQLVALRLELLSSHNGDVRADDGVTAARLLPQIDNMIDTMKSICNRLRPDDPDRLGLVGALESCAAEFQQRSGIICNVTCNQDSDPPLKADAILALYRIVQESLTNVARHAQATQVVVRLQVTGNRLLLSITDNGIGFRKPVASEKAMGILGMSERALMIGGHLTVSNNRGYRGTRVSCQLPLGEP